MNNVACLSIMQQYATSCREESNTPCTRTAQCTWCMSFQGMAIDRWPSLTSSICLALIQWQSYSIFQEYNVFEWCRPPILIHFVQLKNFIHIFGRAAKCSCMKLLTEFEFKKRCTVALVLVYMGQPVLLLHDLQTTSVPPVMIIQINPLPAALI